MTGAVTPGSALSERTWSAMILALSCAVLLITIWCLSQGITIIFMHLYYIPIVLLAYHYRKKGLYLSVLLSLSYFALVAVYMPDDIFTIEGAGIRSILFICVAVLVAYLSEQLVQAREALGRTAHIQQGIIQNANVWLMVLDSAGRILEWNTAAEEMSGFVADEVIGKNEVWKQLYPDKNYRKEITGKITEIIRQENYLENLKTVITGKDGTKKTLMWNTRLLPQEEKGIRRYIAIGVDVTATVNAEYELKKAFHQLTAKEEELRERYEDLARSRNAILESEAEYRNILRTAMDGFSIVDSTRSFLDVNDAFCTMTGYSRNELLTLSLSYIEAKEQQDEIASHMGEIIRKGADRFETKYRKKDGGIIDVEVSVVVSETHGRHFVVFHHDITEQKRAEEALRESEEKFRDIFNNANDGIEIVELLDNGMPGRFNDVNDVACRMLGYTREEMLRVSPLDIDTDYFSRPFDEIMRELHTTGHATFETEHRRKDGIIVPVEVNTHMITLMGKTVFLSITRDITERKHAEAEIQRSIERFRTVMDSIDAFVYVADMQTYELLFINKYGKDVWGEIRGKVCWQTIQSDQKGPCPFCTNNRLVDDKGNPTGIYNWEFKNTVNGRWYDCRDSAIRWLDGRLVRIEIATDITERKQIEEALHESEQKFRDLFENSQDGIVIADTRTKQFVDSNEMFSHMLKYRPEEIKNLGLMDIHPEGGGLHAVEIFEKMARHEINIAGNVPVKRKDGTIFYADISAYPINIFGKDYLVGVFRDITERRQAGELQKHFTEELEQQVRSRTQELEASLDEKIILLREIHHRVKNNLQIIISLVNLQMRKLEDPQLKQIMSETQNRVRAMALVHEKLYQSENYSRIDFADYTRFLATHLISYYGTDLRRVRLDFTMREIMVDINTAVPLGLLINELISNALRHAFLQGREGTISISGGYEGDLITLIVRDNGIGIPADFDWKNTTSLGLHLVTSLVDQVDGTITLDRNAGTSFTITVRRPASEGA